MASPYRLPSWSEHLRRRGWKHYARRGAKFGLTVLSSGFVAFVLGRQWPRTWWPNLSPTPTPVAQKKANPNSDSRTLGRMENLYRQHLDEVVQLIRSKPQYRIIALDLPAQVLGFQRGIASVREGTVFSLETKSARIPVFAVSKSARPLLDQMLIDYIVPQFLPRRALEGALLPFPPQSLNEYLLIPDLTGNNAALFTFERKSRAK